MGIIFAEALREGAYETSNTVSVIAPIGRHLAFAAARRRLQLLRFLSSTPANRVDNQHTATAPPAGALQSPPAYLTTTVSKSPTEAHRSGAPEYVFDNVGAGCGPAVCKVIDYHAAANLGAQVAPRRAVRHERQ